MCRSIQVSLDVKSCSIVVTILFCTFFASIYTRSNSSFVDVVQADLLTNHEHAKHPKDTKLPGPTESWKFFLTTAILFQRNNSILIIGLARWYFFEGCEKHKDHCVHVEDTAPDSWKTGKNNLLRTPRETDPPWECVLPNFEVSTRIWFGPNGATIDAKSNGITENMVCAFDRKDVDLSAISKQQREIQVFIRQQGKSETEAKFHIPTDSLVIGNFVPETIPSDHHEEFFFYPKEDRRRPPLDNFPRISQCTAGLYNEKGMYWALEWVVHHFNIGIQHIFLGIHASPDSSEWEHFRNLYQYFISTGRLSLISTHIPGLRWGGHSVYREVFYNECLYYTKLRSELASVWDIDELLVPHTLQPVYNLLYDEFNAQEATLDKFCSFSFHSLSPTRKVGFMNGIGFLGDRFPYRMHEPEDSWKKTMSFSDNMMQSGIHIPGGCLVSGIDHSVWPGRTEGAYWFPKEKMAIHHFRDVFRQRAHGEEMQRDEYSMAWSELSKGVMCWLFRNGTPNITWYKPLGNDYFYNCFDVKTIDPSSSVFEK